MAALPDFSRQPKHDQSAGEKEKLPERQCKQHHECRQTHANAPCRPSCCHCVTPQQKIRPALWLESKKSKLLQKPHRLILPPSGPSGKGLAATESPPVRWTRAAILVARGSHARRTTCASLPSYRSCSSLYPWPRACRARGHGAHITRRALPIAAFRLAMRKTSSAKPSTRPKTAMGLRCASAGIASRRS